MDTHDATRDIRAKFPTLNEQTLHQMVNAETNAELERLKQQGYRGRDRYVRAVGAAHSHILDWLCHADEYAITDLPDFVASHRAACVWSVLVGQKLKQESAARGGEEYK